MRRVAFQDLRSLHAPLRQQLVEAVAAVIDSGQFILGPEVNQLETEIAAYTGARFAVGCSSGSDALYLALRALDVGPGDRVITTPFTFFATAGAISRTGARPVFVDVEPQTLNLDPKRLAAELSRSGRPAAVIVVHLYGGAADLDAILELCQAAGCPLIEDAAQAIGAEYKGRRVGTFGAAGCISFYPSKNLGALGDAGMLLTNDPQLAERVRLLRVHGSRDRYVHELVGINGRLDAIQAAVLRRKLPYLEEWTRRRQHNAQLYERFLAGAGLPIQLPQPASYQTRHVYHQYVIRCPRRQELQDYLQEHGIDTEVYYPLPLHLQPCYRDLGYREGDFPVAEQAAREVLALPIHPGLHEADIAYVAAAIRQFYAGS